MRSILGGVCLSLALAAPVLAEPRSFSVVDRSDQYLVEVLFPEVPDHPNQLVPALITVRDKHTLETLQQFKTPAANVPVDSNGQDNGWLLGPFSLLYFADFDLDGRLDLAIRNGTDLEQAYKPMFYVYVQTPQNRQWVLNQPLTDLAKETTSGMFSLIPDDGILLSQVDRDCCWTRMSHWKMRDGELVRLSTSTEEQVQPTEFGENSSMPSGYTLITTGALKDGQWQETQRLEGPTHEDVQRLTGTLNGKIPVDIWYQQQGAVLIGELRYTKSGNGQPIKLVGDQSDYDDKPFVYLHEYTDDGHQTGIWRITRDTEAPYDYTGTWVSSAKGEHPELAILLHATDSEPDDDLPTDLERDQRNGHYQMRDDFLGRDGDLELNILPERDAQGREVAEVTLTLKEVKSGKQIVVAHHSVPMEAENLIIVREPMATPRTGPYHIQLVKNFAVIEHNSAPDSDDYLTGMYRKQP